MALIAEATVDAYDESEQRMGFYTMIEEHLDMPFQATILGVCIIVERVDVIDDNQIVAVCRHGVDRCLPPLVTTPVSEFQYFEFVAIDRPLSLSAQRKLRAITSRATITANRLVNTYEWGDFKGDPHALVTQYFDAFLYHTNCGARHLMLRIPVAKLDAKLALQYCAQRQTRSRGILSVATVSANTTHLIFSWWSETNDAEDREELESSALGALTPLRNELISGDYRALYLSWLLRRQAGEIRRTDTVPARPPNMKCMTGSQMALAEFLRIELSGA